jgi:SOS-response transcriptional repressor LexA
MSKIKKLSSTQEKILKFIEAHETSKPTFQEIKDACNLSSTSLAFHHVNQLKVKGYLGDIKKDIEEEINSTIEKVREFSDLIINDLMLLNKSIQNRIKK